MTLDLLPDIVRRRLTKLMDYELTDRVAVDLDCQVCGSEPDGTSWIGFVVSPSGDVALVSVCGGCRNHGVRTRGKL